MLFNKEEMPVTTHAADPNPSRKLWNLGILVQGLAAWKFTDFFWNKSK